MTTETQTSPANSKHSSEFVVMDHLSVVTPQWAKLVQAHICPVNGRFRQSLIAIASSEFGGCKRQTRRSFSLIEAGGLQNALKQAEVWRNQVIAQHARMANPAKVENWALARAEEARRKTRRAARQCA